MTTNSSSKPSASPSSVAPCLQAGFLGPQERQPPCWRGAFFSVHLHARGFGEAPQQPSPVQESTRDDRRHLVKDCDAASDTVLWRIMSAMKTISFRARSAAVKTLDELAESLDRDRSYLLNEAVEQYLEVNEYHIRLIEKGLQAAKEGKLAPHAEVKKLIQKMGRKK